MISAWVLVLAAGATSGGSAFDPKGYIQTMPAEDAEVDDVDAVEAQAEADGIDDRDVAKRAAIEKLPAETAAKAPVRRAFGKVDGKSVIALKSSFGTIYIAKADGITAKSLDSAICASTKSAPTEFTIDRPLDEAHQDLEATILKAIETHCRPTPPGGKAP